MAHIFSGGWRHHPLSVHQILVGEPSAFLADHHRLSTYACFTSALQHRKSIFMKRQNNKGFTLIELLVVISIIGVLSGVVLQSLGYSRARARNTVRLSDIDQIDKAFNLYATGGQSYPSVGGWVCIGNIISPCWQPLNAYPDANTNNVIKSSISMIPYDPLFKYELSDAYLYISNYTPIGFTHGAYLGWVTESIGQAQSTACGRGNYFMTLNPPNKWFCILRISDAV